LRALLISIALGPALAFLVDAASARAEEGLPKRTLGELIAIARRTSTTVAAATSQLEVREAQKSEAIRNWYPSGEFNALLTIAPKVVCLPSPPSVQSFNAANPGVNILGGNSSQFANDTAAAFRQQNCSNTIDPRTVPIDAITHMPVPFDARTALINAANVSTLSPNVGGIGLGINFRLTQPVYTFGKIEHGYRAAKRGIEAEEARIDIARAEAELNVARAYWGLTAARASRATAGAARDELASRVDQVAKDLESDTPKFTVYDLQRLKVALINTDLIISDIERNVEIAQAGLSAAVGEPSDIDDTELDAVEIIEHPIDYYESEALWHRPEVLALDKGVQALRELQKLKLAEMLPDLAFVFGLDYRFAPSVEDSTNAFVNHANQLGYSFFLTLHQNLDLFERHAKYVHARADANVLAAQRTLALAGIGFEIATAYQNLVEARRRMAIADKGQHVAQGWLNAIRQNLDLGTSDSRDLVEAARAYYELRLRFYQSIYDLNLDVAILRKATGVEIAK
jgi:outer membrane protein TolC